jgi:hypothetical protein
MTLLNGLGFARQSSTDGGEQDPGGRRSRAAALRAFRCAVECLSRASRGYGAAEPRPPILPEKSPRIAGRSRIYAMGGIILPTFRKFAMTREADAFAIRSLATEG